MCDGQLLSIAIGVLIAVLILVAMMLCWDMYARRYNWELGERIRRRHPFNLRSL